MTGSLISRLISCECCPRKCGVDRINGKTGFCRTGSDIRVAHAGLHFGEEPPISGTRGSGTIFFTGCNLRCVFCQNYQISQEFADAPNQVLSVEELASEILRLQKIGAHNINFVSPSHLIFQIADVIEKAKHMGLTIPVVYNSNGYDSVEALRQIKGLVDIYLPDLKYLDNRPGKLFSAVDDYADIVPAVIREMLDQTGHLQLDSKGIAISGVLVRHLVLPGELENSRKCLRMVAEVPDLHISIMSQYSPQYKAKKYKEIGRALTEGEYHEIIGYALELGIENAFIQELDSQSHYLPDFNQKNPF